MRTENQNIKIKCPKIEKLHLQKKKITFCPEHEQYEK